jgi:hypothetical protein
MDMGIFLLRFKFSQQVEKSDTGWFGGRGLAGIGSERWVGAGKRTQNE